MANQHTPKGQRAEATVIKPVRWSVTAWREVQRRARAARMTESEYIREQTLRDRPTEDAG